VALGATCDPSVTVTELPATTVVATPEKPSETSVTENEPRLCTQGLPQSGLV
jgi:hypothetical protein